MFMGILKKKEPKTVSVPIERKQNPEVAIPQSMLSGLLSTDEESFEKIVLEMLNPEDVEMKTEVHSPVALTRLETMAIWYDFENVPECAKLIREFCKLYRVNMVSFNRQSRKEIKEILTEGLKRERSIGEKLAGKPT
jgi:hypothetical protein